MKSKFKKNVAAEVEDDDIESDVEGGGPAIAAAGKSKFAVIAASSILVTVVVYFLFFKTEPQKVEKLEEVAAPKAQSVASSETGKSPFEIDVPESKDNESEIVESPLTPQVPTLPSLPMEAIPEESVIPAEQPAAPAPTKAVENKVEQKSPDAQKQVTETIEQQPLAEKNANDPRYSPIVVFSGAAEGSPARGVGYENNIVQLNQDPISKLEETKSGVTATYIKDRPHTIAQGKLLTAILETAINTEVPGFVRAVISRDVYGEAGNEVLIPRGSRLFGSYSSKITQGQGRVEIGWTRLIRPDGVDLAISFSASDQFGRSGISGEVDSKYGAIIANSMLTSILAVGGVSAAQKLLTNNATTTTTTNPTQGTTTTTGSAANQAIYDVSKTIIDTVGQVIGNAINVKPVIRVPQGTRITVIVNSDIMIPSMK